MSDDTTDVTLTKQHLQRLVSRLCIAMQTLKVYSIDTNQLTHRQRKSVEMTVHLMLKDVKTDLQHSLDPLGTDASDFPF